jgi:hypothetical protein
VKCPQGVRPSGLDLSAKLHESALVLRARRIERTMAEPLEIVVRRFERRVGEVS